MWLREIYCIASLCAGGLIARDGNFHTRILNPREWFSRLQTRVALNLKSFVCLRFLVSAARFFVPKMGVS